jgi:hypothetical protein
MSNRTASADQTLLESVAQTIQTAPAMTTSSAEPARLEGYPDALAAADEQLTALARDLDRALGAFAAGAGAYLPAGFDPASDGELVRGLRDESQYQASWVARIGAGFRAADADIGNDGIFSANDGFLDSLVGAPTLTIPDAGTDPAEVAQWWATMPQDLRNRMIRRDYAQLGRLRGLPAADTDRINRRRLGRDLSDLRQRKADLERRLANADSSFERRQILAELTPVNTGLANAEKIADQMAALDEHHRTDRDHYARPYLLTYGYQDNGRFAVALGDPDHAANTAVVVPGTGHDVNHEGGLFGPVSEGERLLGEMNYTTGDTASGLASGATTNSVIVWMGTDMPDDIPQAMNGTYGDNAHGADWLRDDVAGYQAAHAQAQPDSTAAGAEGHTTVVAHSYGSYMSGEAIKGGMRVDDFVSVGSPGIDADNPGELGMANEHVWAGRTSGDAFESDGDIIGSSRWFGSSPTAGSFDATVFATDDSSRHSEYYKAQSQSLANLARISTGHYGDVELRPPDPF